MPTSELYTYFIGLILTVILFIYVVVSGGILKGIIVILCTIVLTSLGFVILWNMYENNDKGALIIAPPYIAAFTSCILTIIMAIYIFTSNFTTPTPTPSTIV